MKTNDFINLVENKYPLSLQEDWDCSGLLYDGKKGINNVLVCLDITPSVARYAIENSVDLIVSHHPIIFADYASTTEYLRETFLTLYSHNISVYSIHTNYDNHRQGMNSQYVRLLGYKENEIDCDNMLKTFNADKTFMSKVLDVNKNIRVYNQIEDVDKVAVCLGAGGSLIEEVNKKNCNVFISSEFKHHEILYAKEYNIMLIDVTHQAEMIFVDDIAQFLNNNSLNALTYKDFYKVEVFK